ncbi:LamB/YcsF family protein [Alkalihalobacillus sp. MEB130]|uniref:LamB/YcsF family protein n=1 Tax=Alkalihalobacillus sp. MEB130 TaxID=2976704 RepID=UPI0028DDC547|nr:5-oxoprolinase subunit PxpA [Alkalihalobacillus sp. MEB130]MDT8862690.1 LamB/YcsF family protein [Alkalihalobacillus sp. MEB130]
MTSVDINCDLGESFGAYKIGQDELILDHVTSANVACGYHAGDHNVMATTVKMAAAKGVKIGAHPGFPDLLGFGRRIIETNPEDVYNFVIYQISALKGFCDIEGVTMQHVKPHGALYNLAATNENVADAIAQAVYDVDPALVLFGLSQSKLTKAGLEKKLRVANEVFADRTYQADGTLTPRSQKHALIHDVHTAIDQVVTMAKTGTVKAINGTVVPIQADTICIHGDGENALTFAKELKRVLHVERISIKPIL